LLNPIKPLTMAIATWRPGCSAFRSALAVEADLGPVRNLATLLGSTGEQTMRWFILVVALLLDPAAALLVLAATHRRQFGSR
jgi:hypothetical protein